MNPGKGMFPFLLVDQIVALGVELDLMNCHAWFLLDVSFRAL